MQPIPNEVIERFTRDAVRGVFNKMLAIEVMDDRPTPLAADPAGHIIGSVGFIGQTIGIVYLHAGVSLARVVTGTMLGLTAAEVEDDMINDAFGELNNMVAGYVKSQVCDRGWPCELTIPSIVRGNELQVETVADVKRTFFGFRAGEHRLLVEIAIKDARH
jgi:chemotaxis protein CheX